MAMWKPTSITGGQRSIFSCHVASASGIDCPGACRQKSISEVVPPNAADTVPEVKSRSDGAAEGHLHVRVGIHRAWITYFPAASMTRSAVTSSEAPIAVIVSPSIRMSAA